MVVTTVTMVDSMICQSAKCFLTKRRENVCLNQKVDGEREEKDVRGKKREKIQRKRKKGTLENEDEGRQKDGEERVRKNDR